MHGILEEVDRALSLALGSNRNAPLIIGGFGGCAGIIDPISPDVDVVAVSQ